MKVTATVNDRGPFHPNRLIDVSFAIAKTLGIVHQGVALVEVRLLDDADLSLNLNDGPAAISVPKQGVKPPVQWPPKIK
jgi:rare lipoprotein A